MNCRRRKALSLLGLALALVLGAAGCRRSAAPVPRPEAYPRIDIYPAAYAAIDSLPLVVEANTSARVVHRGPLWIDINYPAYRATIYLTLTPTCPDSIEAVLANRRQRMALNISDPTGAEVSSLSNDDFDVEIIRSNETRTTPLQFVAADEGRWVVSGTVFFNAVAPDAPIDSMMPMVDAVYGDLLHAMQHLSHRP